ncbi:thioredoxin-disulfide reductase [Xanthobacter sediminis]
MQAVHSEILVLGAGPAGYTAAIYAARAGRSPILLTGLQPGGQLMVTSDVENYPGFAEAIQGPWLMDQMRRQAEHVGVRVLEDHIAALDATRRPFVLEGEGARYSCDALIFATGAQARWLGLPSEAAFRGLGVSACATCDGFFYRGRSVMVVGGGNTAVEEALYLANIAAKVTLVHRRDTLRCERILEERLRAHPKIELRWNAAVEEILGDGDPPAVRAVRLRDVGTGAVSTLATDGVFVAIGHAPASDLLDGQVEMHASGYVKVHPGSTRTSVPGLFAAGDVADAHYRQAVTAAGFGCMAALDADRFLSLGGPPVAT